MSELFFPLNDELGGAWWDSVVEEGGDCFVTAFCVDDILLSVGVHEEDAVEDQSFATIMDDGTILLGGLVERVVDVALFDMHGRAVAKAALRPATDGTARWLTPSLPNGSYVLRYGAKSSTLVNAR